MHLSAIRALKPYLPPLCFALYKLIACFNWSNYVCVRTSKYAENCVEPDEKLRPNNGVVQRRPRVADWDPGILVGSGLFFFCFFSIVKPKIQV